MKHFITFQAICLLSLSLVIAQAPQAFNYQAVVRDAQGSILSDQEMTFFISILQGSTDGQVVYAESHKVTTNAFGLVNIDIGKGKKEYGERNNSTGYWLPATGYFNNIDWSLGTYYLKIEIDTQGGSNFKEMGITQLLSVPYALYAETSGNSGLRDGTEWNHAAGNVHLDESVYPSANVGVGTTVPSGKLHIQGEGFGGLAAPMLMVEHRAGYSSTFRRVVNNAGNALFLLQKARGTIESPNMVGPGDNLGQIRMEGYDGTDYREAGFLRVIADNAVGSGFVTGAMIFATTPMGSATSVERMRITSYGKVGIGTSAPSDEAQLHVENQTDHNYGILIDYNGQSGTQIGLHTGSASYASLAKNAYYLPGTATWNRFNTCEGATLQETEPGGNISFKTIDAGTNPITWNNAMYIKANGSVGIGSNSPLTDLHVLGSTTLGQVMIGTISMQNGNSELYLTEDFDGWYSMLFQYNGSEDKLKLLGKESSTIYGPHLTVERINGNVGIGYTSTNAKLAVNGNVGIATTNAGSKLAVYGLNGTSSYSWLKINTTTGQFYWDNFSMHSKDNIHRWNKDCNLILSAEPKTFIDRESRMQEFGLLAEDLDELGLNDIVIYDEKNNPISVDHSRVSLYLLEIIKDQQQRIRELEQRMAWLETK